jgi:hypothetical protein
MSAVTQGESVQCDGNCAATLIRPLRHAVTKTEKAVAA